MPTILLLEDEESVNRGDRIYIKKGRLCRIWSGNHPGGQGNTGEGRHLADHLRYQPARRQRPGLHPPGAPGQSGAYYLPYGPGSGDGSGSRI